MNVFDLFAKLSLDTSGYSQPLNDAGKSTEDFKDKSKIAFEDTAKASESFGKKLKKGLAIAATATTAALTATKAAAIATTAAFLKGVATTAEYGDTIDKQSQKLGLSTKSYQEWDYVLNLAGTSMQNMNTGMKTMTNQLDAAKKGNKDAIANFKALGISMNDIKKMSREELFDKTISGFQKMEDGTKRAALANKLFGKSGQELTPVFNMTNDETSKLIKQANEYGMVMDDKAVKASANYKDSLTTLKNTMAGVKNNLLGDFMPSITTVMDGLAMVFGGKEGGSKTIEVGLMNMVSKFQENAPKFFSVATTIINALISGFGPMLPQLTSSIFSVLIQAITTVSSMVPQLMPAIISGIQGAASALMQALPVIIDGVTQLLMALATWLSDANNVQMMVSGVVQLVSQLVNSFAMILPVLLPAIVTIISEVANALTQPDNVEMLIDAILTIIGALAVAIGKSLPILAKAVTQIIKNLGELLGRFFEKAVPLVAEGIGNIVNKAKALGENIKTTVSNFFKDGLTNLGKFVSDILGKLKDLPSKALSLGSDLVKGLWNGISNMSKWIGEKIKGFGKGVLDGLKSFFKIKSPSRLFRDEIGKFLALGVGEGFTVSMPKVVSDMVDEAKDATKSIADVISAGSVGDAISTSVTKAASFGGSAASNSSSNNITINVYGAEGQDVRELAKVVSQEIQNLINDKEKAFA